MIIYRNRRSVLISILKLRTGVICTGAYITVGHENQRIGANSISYNELNMNIACINIKEWKPLNKHKIEKTQLKQNRLELDEEVSSVMP